MAYITLTQKMEKWPILTAKPWTNPFGKMANFRLFKLPVFVAWKRVFSLYNIVKDIFLAYITLTQNMEKWPILNKTMD